NPQSTAQVMADGWLRTGDIGSIDVDGNLYITGRKKETIIVKGQNIHPSDLEVVLSAHPQVEEVAVLGVPDELRGEVVAAVITLKKDEVVTEYELRRFCLERLASYKAPKQFIFLDSLPRTASGEIDKEGIRKQLSIPSIFPGKVVSE
ncbi:MAG: AMP-binding protein, partial [Dehalococcoidales bacterium]